MRMIGTALTMILAAGTAAAQHRSEPQRRDYNYTISMPNEVKDGAIQQGDVRDCHVRRRGEEPECRSRDGWRNVQRQVDRLKPPADFEQPR